MTLMGFLSLGKHKCMKMNIEKPLLEKERIQVIDLIKGIDLSLIHI